MKKNVISVFYYIHEQITGVKPPPGFLASSILLIFLLIVGMLFYSNVEKWSYLDALYFSFITLATVGYGDFYPTLPISKIFTMFYIFIGVGLELYIITTFSANLVAGKTRQMKMIEEQMTLMENRKKQ